jgi:hypothetical protein
LRAQAVRTGDIALARAVGCGMKRDSLGIGAGFCDLHLDGMAAVARPLVPRASLTVQMFGNAGREHMKFCGSTPGQFAWIGWKNFANSVRSGRPDDLGSADETTVLANVRRCRGRGAR